MRESKKRWGQALTSTTNLFKQGFIIIQQGSSHRLGKYDESIRYCRKGLKWTIGEERLFGIADLFYQIGFNLEMKGELEESLPYFQKGRNYFHIQKNTKFVDFIDGKIAEVEEKLAETMGMDN